MKTATQALICVLSLLLGACTATKSICRGPLHPINVHDSLPQESAP